MKRFPPKRILVAADLSAPSLAALDAAKELALRWDADLEVVHVQNSPESVLWAGPDSMPLSVPAPAPEPRRKIEEKLRRAAAGIPDDRLKLRTLRGWPQSVLLELARPERADLMVMGTHGYAGLDRLLTGSVAEAVIRHARIPVLTVPERKSVSGVTRVLAPWNGRPYAARALRWSRELARSLGATLDVLHIEEGAPPSGKARQALDRRLTALLGAGPDWTLRSRAGEARARIVAEANSGRCGIVVLSAHRRPFVGDFVLGSTVERLLRHAAVPVLAVPSGLARPRLIRRPARAGTRLY